MVTFVWLSVRAGILSKHNPPICQVPGRETLDKDIGSNHITMKHFLLYNHKRDDGATSMNVFHL